MYNLLSRLLKGKLTLRCVEKFVFVCVFFPLLIVTLVVQMSAEALGMQELEVCRLEFRAGLFNFLKNALKLRLWQD